MDRRELLRLGTATFALAASSKTASAQAPRAPAPAAGSSFALSAYSRNLQWLRTPQALTKGIVEIGLSRVDLTVSSANGHVDPAGAATDLPAFVSALKAGGITTTCITTDITGADSPHAEAILKAAAAAGVTHYVWGGLTYDETRPYGPQLDALKPRIARLARLNERYKIKGLYQPARGAGAVGSTFFDILQLLRAHDPRFVGIHYNTANLLQATPETMAVHLRTGGAYIGGLAVTDARVHLKLPDWDEGPYDWDPDKIVGAYSGGDWTGDDGADPLALGGGGRPLPYRYEPLRVGTGMVDMSLLSKTLKDIGFSGPAETQVTFELAGVETGATAITAERLNVIGQIKRERLLVEHAFHKDWNTEVALPSFILRRNGAAVPAEAATPPPAGAPPD